MREQPCFRDVRKSVNDRLGLTKLHNQDKWASPVISPLINRLCRKPKETARQKQRYRRLTRHYIWLNRCCTKQYGPIWTYSVQLWGTASDSNVEIIQRFQNKYLNAP